MAKKFKAIITCSTKKLFKDVSKKLVEEGYEGFDNSYFLKGENWGKENNSIDVSSDDFGFCSLEFYEGEEEYNDYEFLTAEKYLGKKNNIKKVMSEKKQKDVYLVMYDDASIEEYDSLSGAKVGLLEAIEDGGMELNTIKIFKGHIVGVPVIEFK